MLYLLEDYLWAYFLSVCLIYVTMYFCITCITSTDIFKNLLAVLGFCVGFILSAFSLFRIYKNIKVILILRLFLYLGTYIVKFFKSVDPIYTLYVFFPLYPFFEICPPLMVGYVILLLCVLKEDILDVCSLLATLLRGSYIYLIELFDIVNRLKVSLYLQNNSSFAVVLLDIFLLFLIFILLAGPFATFICGYMFIGYSMILCSFCNLCLMSYFHISLLNLLSCHLIVIRIVGYLLRLQNFAKEVLLFHHLANINFTRCVTQLHKYVKGAFKLTLYHFKKVNGLTMSRPIFVARSINRTGVNGGSKFPNPNSNNSSNNVGTPHGNDSNESNHQDDSNVSLNSEDLQAIEPGFNPELPLTPQAVEDFSSNPNSSVNSNDSFDSAELRADREFDGNMFQSAHRGPPVDVAGVNLSVGPNVPAPSGDGLNLGLPSLEEFYHAINPFNIGSFDPEELMAEGLSAFTPSHEFLSTSMGASLDMLPSLEEIPTCSTPNPSNIAHEVSNAAMDTSSDSLPSLEEIPTSTSPPDSMEE